jgi:diguanylate cyclase (GGDEF)-like protein/PAS domain S-box-containing protein
MALVASAACAALASAVLGAALAGVDLRAASRPVALTRISELRHLPDAQLGGALPVHLHAVVTYYDTVGPNLFVQDSTGGIWVDLRASHLTPPRVGQAIDLRGTARLGFSPYIANPSWRVAGSAPEPQPLVLPYGQAATGSWDARWVQMDGVVRSFVQQAEGSVLVMDVATPTGTFKVRIPDYHASFPLQLVDAMVRFRGVCGAVFNRRNQLVAVNLLVPSLAHARILTPAPPDPFAVPATPIANIRRFSADLPDVHRVKVHGIVTAPFFLQGLFLMDSTGGVYAESQDGTPLHAGDEVDVVGFPAEGAYSPVLRSASLRPTGRHQPIQPVPVSGAVALRGASDAQLVRIEATVQSVRQSPDGSTLILDSDDRVPFEAAFRAPGASLSTVPPGARVVLTGICSIRTDENGNSASFQIVLRAPSDIAILSRPPWLNGRRASFIVLAVALLALAILGWVVILRRRVRRQTRIIEAKLQNELALEARYRSIFERNLTGLYIAQEDGSLTDCNDACAHMLGFRDRRHLLACRADAEKITRSLHRNFDRHGAIVNAEHRFLRYDGSWGWVLSNARLLPLNGDGPRVLEGALVDITDRKLADERIQTLAWYDSLTGLPNRALLQDRLRKAIAGARRHHEKLAVLFLDLDNFKNINDSLGHSCGDLLLQQVAQRLSSCAREQDTVARLGGDEFLIVLGSVDNASGAAAFADRVAREIGQEYPIQSQFLSVTCSIGISLFPDHGADVETLTKNADAAMYLAKDEGRNAIRFFNPSLTIQRMQRLTLENNLRSVLEKEQLYLVYQPEFHVATGAIACWETLLRWQHPEYGLIPPDRFIRIAEDSGAIVPIGEWVLRTACRQAVLWQKLGLPPVPVAVNVSAVQFCHEGFSEAVLRALADSGLPPSLLELEITESLLLSHDDLIFDLLSRLRAIGVHLAIDDFGTGYSSLSYLRQFPVRKLKIDRSFIRDLSSSPGAAAIVAAMIDMARSLHLTVTAEGVESGAELARLRDLGCDEAQGFLYSHPLLPEQITPALCSALPSKLLDPVAASQSALEEFAERR